MSEDEDEELQSRGDRTRARKAAENELAKLAKALVALPPKQQSKLELAEGVADALAEARRMKSHGARARQLRVVRRELREVDHAAIAEALAILLDPRRQTPAEPGPAQRWVSAFLDEGNEAVERFLGEHPSAERQHLHRLTRNARQANAAKAKKAKKALLAAVRSYMSDNDASVGASGGDDEIVDPEGLDER